MNKLLATIALVFTLGLSATPASADTLTNSYVGFTTGTEVVRSGPNPDSITMGVVTGINLDDTFLGGQLRAEGQYRDTRFYNLNNITPHLEREFDQREASAGLFYDTNLPLKPYVGAGLSYKSQRFNGHPSYPMSQRHVRNWTTPFYQVGIRPQVNKRLAFDVHARYSDSQGDWNTATARTENPIQVGVGVLYRLN